MTRKPQARRRRRSTEEVRERILRAARDVFSVEGYPAATTRLIAERAGVVEPLIFRNFRSKADLFVRAALEPVAAVITEQVQRMDVYETLSTEELVERFLTDVYSLFSRERDLMLTVLRERGSSLDRRVSEGARLSFDEILTRLEKLGRERTGERQVVVEDALVETRAIFAMAMGLALFRDWLLPPGRRQPSTTRVVRAMTKLTLTGLGAPSHGPPTSRRRNRRGRTGRKASRRS